MRNLLLLAALAFVSGCSNFTINGTMCDQIASDPNTQNIPQECRKYNEKEAEKAFFKNKKKKPDVDDVIEFQNDKEKKE